MADLPLWKMMEFVSWDYYSQHMEKYKCSKPPTSHNKGYIIPTYGFWQKKHFSEDICPVYNRLSLNFWLFRTIVRSIDNRNCSPKYGEMGSPMLRNIPLMITDYIMINKNNIIIYIYMWTASKHHLPPSELRIAPSSNNYLQQYPSNLTNWHSFYALGHVPLGCNS